VAGKAKRAAAHKKKMADKRAAKAARRALYASLRGTSKKNKKRNMKRKGEARFNSWSPRKHKHLVENCGNPGCLRCFPRLNLRFYAHKIVVRSK
jgi:hypothetical protein